ncbi:MAG TPA: hypothetical protein VMB73_20280 [Acetobacteraceae bacterium]|nr:hypothetical protein [Acetobacteraceae bacterium]
MSPLRSRPADFFIQDGRLCQKNCAVSFIIRPSGLLVAESGSEGGRGLLSPHDAARLSAAYEEWQWDYWIPARINGIFARQLRRPPIWRRLWHRIELRLPERQAGSALAIYAHVFAREEIARRRPNDEPPPRERPRPRRPILGGDAADLRHELQLIE